MYGIAIRPTRGSISANVFLPNKWSSEFKQTLHRTWVDEDFVVAFFVT